MSLSWVRRRLHVQVLGPRCRASCASELPCLVLSRDTLVVRVSRSVVRQFLEAKNHLQQISKSVQVLGYGILLSVVRTGVLNICWHQQQQCERAKSAGRPAHALVRPLGWGEGGINILFLNNKQNYP